MFKYKIILLFLLCTYYSFAQTDTTQMRGTIKIGKPKDGEIYIKTISNFDNFDLPKIAHDFSKNELFQPYPIVEGFSYPFNYTKYFNDNFKSKQIDLKGKTNDTVVLEVKILANGKIYIKDKSRTMMIKNLSAIYNEKEAGFELNNLHLNCLAFLKNIKQWTPGYIVFPIKDKFKGETVIKLNKKNVDVTGTITILFSSTPFED